MKYLIIRCEDHACQGTHVASLLEGAKAVHLQHLAQAGAAGLIRQKSSEQWCDRFALHRALFGLGPEDLEASAGWCYAAGTNLRPSAQETVWCCDFVTQRDGAVADATAGNIQTKESNLLLQALNAELGSDTRRWEVGHGSRHVFLTSDPALSVQHAAVRSGPDVLIGQSWKKHLPDDPLREPLQRLMEQAALVLERHDINRVRLDLGENPANLAWFWGAAPRQEPRKFSDRTGLSGAVISSSFPMRGFATCLGLEWRPGLTSFDETAFEKLLQELTTLLQRHDWVYVHVRVDSADPVDRLCAVERVDQLLLKPLTGWLPEQGPWRMAAVIDERSVCSPLWVAIGSGLPQQGVEHLSPERLAQSSLNMNNGLELFAWLTQKGE